MKKLNKKAFSLIELMIAMFVFFMWVISVYAIINTTIKLNSYNRDYIIATNLSREQVELVRNIRDTNFSKIQNYRMLNPNLWYSSSNIFESGAYYKVENDFSSLDSFWVKVEKGVSFDLEKLEKNEDYRLCLDSNNLYVFCSDGVDLQKTPFYKYVKIEEVPSFSGSFKVISKVMWKNRAYHEFEIKSILTDYKIF